MFTVLVSGSRHDPERMVIDRVKYSLGSIAHKLCPEGGLLRHGDANGVDTLCASVWESFGSSFTTKAYPYLKGKGKAGGPLRNQQMVDDGAHVGLFFPAPDSVGTYDCLQRAKTAGIRCFELVSYFDIKSFEHYLKVLSSVKVDND